MGDEGLVPSHSDARRVGRPRKWASDAERKRAYRQRLAADFENVLGLRRDLRRERQRAAALERHNQRLRGELDAARAQTVAANTKTATARDRIAALETELERTRSQLFEARAGPAAHSSPSSAPVRASGPPCQVRDCDQVAVVRSRGARGVERDLCRGHARLDRRQGRQAVVRRYDTPR